MKKILLALLIWSVSSTSLAKGGFFQNCRDPITGKLIYSSDCMGLPKKALPSAVNDGRDEIISIRKNFDGSLDVKYADGHCEHLYKRNDGTFSPFLEVLESKQ